MHPYHEQELLWAKDLAECSDEELVSRHNRSVGVRCFGFARQKYLKCLMREILSRKFDSGILFRRDASGRVTAYRLSFRVEILEKAGSRVLVGIVDQPTVQASLMNP